MWKFKIITRINKITMQNKDQVYFNVLAEKS